MKSNKHYPCSLDMSSNAFSGASVVEDFPNLPKVRIDSAVNACRERGDESAINLRI